MSNRLPILDNLENVFKTELNNYSSRQRSPDNNEKQNVYLHVLPEELTKYLHNLSCRNTTFSKKTDVSTVFKKSQPQVQKPNKK